MSAEALVWVGFAFAFGAMGGGLVGNALSSDFWRHRTEARKMLHAERMALFAQRERMLFDRERES